MQETNIEGIYKYFKPFSRIVLSRRHITDKANHRNFK